MAYETSAILPHGLVTRRAAHMSSVTAELRGLAPLCRAMSGGPGLPAPMPQAGAASLIPLSSLIRVSRCDAASDR
jgi:hypothetical protein